MPPTKLLPVDYRARARIHYDNALLLLETGDSDQLIYGCLELRMAIEALTYEKVQLYRSDLTEDDFQKWQPATLMKAVVEVDPDAESDIVIEIGPVDETDPDQRKLTFIDNRMKAKWTGMAHNALGNFLHEHTLLAIQRGSTPTADRVRSKATEISEEINRVLSSNGWNWSPKQIFKVSCNCDRPIRIELAYRQKGKRLKCEACARLIAIERDSKEPDKIIATIDRDVPNGMLP